MIAPLAAAVLAGLVLAAPGLQVPPASARADAPQARSADPAPQLPVFAATDLAGARWTPAQLAGRVTLIDFWATWCAPCLAELPRLKALRARHARRDFEILGVSLDVRSRHSLVGWLNRQRIDWPQIHERSGYGGDIPRRFGIDSLPRTIVVGRDGTVAAVDLRGARLEAAIDALVAASDQGGLR